MTQATGNNGHIFEFGKFVLDPNERILLANGEPVHLTDKVFDTLYLLVRNNGRLLTKEQMMASIWEESFVEEGNLAKNISRLRKILNGDDAAVIETIPRRGYRFAADVKEVDGDTSLLVRRNLRVKITQTQEDDENDTASNIPISNGNARVALNVPVHARSTRRWLTAGLGTIALASMAVTGWFLFGKPGPAASANVAHGHSGPIRLTDNLKHDTNPRWTKDGQIRFFRVGEDRKTEALVMNADGSGQTVVKELANMDWGGHWSPDGSKVLFSKRGDDTTWYLANADGSDEIELPFKGGNMDWSPDLKQIVYQKVTEANKNSEIFVYTIDTRESVNVTNSPAFDADPSFSPDGKQIVFASGRDGNVEIYLMNVDGSDVRRLTNHAAWDSHPFFSPDGTQIAFPSDRNAETADIYVMNIDGRNVRRLTDWPSNESVIPGGWSPDGTQFVFYSDRYGNDDVFVMSAEAYPVTLVLEDEESDLAYPSYSPDGRHVVYQAARPDRTGEIRILDTTSKQVATVTATKFSDLQPRISPDGESIVFQNWIESNTEICVIRKDGTELRNLSRNDAKDITPSFSPDGKQIAFGSNRGENRGSWMLYTMNSDGSDQRLLHPTTGWVFSPLWWPDGKRLIFTIDSGGAGSYDLKSIEPGVDGSERQLTTRPRVNGHPALSPDGKRIAFSSNADGNWEIYLMNSDGSGQVRLTRNRAEDITPSFSPDGSKLIFSSKRSGKLALYEIALSD